MKNGEMKCFKSVMHAKSVFKYIPTDICRYGSGYVMEIKVSQQKMPSEQQMQQAQQQMQSQQQSSMYPSGTYTYTITSLDFY